MAAGRAVVRALGRNSSTSSSRVVTSAPHTSPVTIASSCPAALPPEPGPYSAEPQAGMASARLRTACQPRTGAVETPKQRHGVLVPRRRASTMPSAKASSRPVASQAPHRSAPGAGSASSPTTPNSRATTAGASSRRAPGTGASASTAAVNSPKDRRPETLLTEDARKTRPIRLLIKVER
nr:hypothetical protein [Streptomyces sp. ODS25]